MRTDWLRTKPSAGVQLSGPCFVISGLWMRGSEQKRLHRTSCAMALECEGAFPDAVDAIVDFLVPYRIYRLSDLLRPVGQRHDTVVAQHPAAFVRLANALIDPAVYPVPNDLAAFLGKCLTRRSVSSERARLHPVVCAAKADGRLKRSVFGSQKAGVAARPAELSLWATTGHCVGSGSRDAVGYHPSDFDHLRLRPGPGEASRRFGGIGSVAGVCPVCLLSAAARR